jgi:hypothetical protein
VDPKSFWVNPFGLAFSLIKASDLILVNHDGQVIDGGPCRLLNSAAFMIHSAIHHARPDVAAAAHSHSIYGRTFCALGRTLEPITQDSCAFYNVSPLSLCSGPFIVNPPSSILRHGCTCLLTNNRTTSFMIHSTELSWRKRRGRTLQRR